jgi:filamentous hemagglutinin family protein
MGLGFFAGLLLAYDGLLSAQVVLDGKFGTSGPVSGPNFNITAGMGATRGNNLFHSFSQFDLKAGDVATFTGPANIQNILSRVTGDSPSSIDGTIRSGIQGANFYLINPKGIVFGPNASVDVSGSFAASTANYLKLADGARFVASLDADDSALSTAPVSAFGFLGENSGSISVQGPIKVLDGKTISLVGGDLAVDGGTVQAPQGQINVASVQSAGEVPADLGTLNAAQFTAAFPKQGQISLQNAATIDASGEGGGSIVIRGARLTAVQSSIRANTTGATDGKGIDVGIQNDLTLVNGGQIISASPTGQGAGGNINISAGSIALNGQGAVDQNFSPSTQITTSTGDSMNGGGPARGGDISIKTGSLDLENSAQISSASFGAGNAGRIDITASSIHIDADLTTITQISANSQPTTGVGGNTGDIIIRTGSLDMFNGATIFAATSGSGLAGQIDIQAHTINLRRAASIIGGTFGPENGGNVNVTADSIYINGQDTVTGGPDFLTGIQSVTSSQDSPAPGGNVHINAGTIDLEHMGSFYTTSYGIGQGGNVVVNAGSLKLGTGSTISSSGLSTGPAGTLSISSSSDIQLTGSSAITTSALQSSGGDIHVDAGHDIRVTDSQVTAQAGPGGGGNITLTAPSMIYLLRGTLTAQAEGDGGNLSMINPVFFIMNNGGLISKSTSHNGGNITILSDFFFQSGSTIDASAPFGLPGTVSVSAPQVDLSGVLVGLPSNLLDAENQLRPDCAVRLSDNVSSFIMLGQGGLPLQPGGFVPSGTVPPVNESK